MEIFERQTDERSSEVRPIAFLEDEQLPHLPAPLVRVNCCGLLSLEVLTEVVSSDPPRGRYRIIASQTLRGRGAVPALMLLKLLTSQPHRFASKDWLSTQMHEEMERGALIRLDTMASQLRTLLGFGGLDHQETSAVRLLLVEYLRNGRGSGPGYQLAPSPLIWLDTDALAWNVEQAARMERFGQDALSWWERAYVLASRGEYLPDDPYSEWAADKRAQVEGALRQCVHALHHLYLAHHGAAGAQQALLLLRSYWLTHKTDEDALRPLMELLGKEERYNEAEEDYQQFLLAFAELGPTKDGHSREPDPRTQDIREYLRTKQIQRQRAQSPTKNGVEEANTTPLSLPSEQQRSVSNPKRRSIDWGVAPSPDQFYGRSKELSVLKSWLEEEHCRLVVIFGMGGIGKTSLSVALATHMKDTFEYVFWRSLQHAPPLQHILHEGVKFFSGQQQTAFPEDLHDQISLLIECLREHRCLFILDNVETVLQDGADTGSYREGYEDYGAFFHLIGEAGHRSCLLLTSREKPKELSRLEGSRAPIRALPLSGVGLVEGQVILQDKGIFGSDEAWEMLIQRYAGNPLALKLVAEPIRELFGASISAFLGQENSVVGDIYGLLDQQFKRLPPREQDILYWLAIEREAISLETLWEDTVTFASKKELLDSLISLRRKSMIEPSDTASFTLQPVIMEYVTDEFIREIGKEIYSETFYLFASHALSKAQSKEYVRESQTRLILMPIVKWLFASMEREEVEKKFKALLPRFRETSHQNANYTAGNLLNLLIQMHYDLRGYDFSHLPIRQAFLQATLLPDVDFTYADLTTSVFTDTFGSILSVAFSPNGALLAAGTTNNDIRVWHTSRDTPHQIYQGHSAWVRSIAFSPDGRVLASGSDDRTICLWDVDSGQCLAVLQGHSAWVRSIAFSPDGRMLASGGEDQTICLWEVSTGHCLNVLQGQVGRIRAIAFSPDGHLLASGGEDQVVHLWEVGTGHCLKTLQGHNERIRSVAFHPNGKTLASGSDDQMVRLWEVSTGHCLNVLQGHKDCVRSVIFSFDGCMLASGGEDQTVRLWEVSSGTCLKTLQGHTNWVWSVVFSPDGNILASGSEDQTVRLWEVNSGHCLKTLQGYVNWVWSITFSPDGNILVSGNEDQTIQLWEVSSGTCLKTLQGHTSRVRSIAVSQNGRTLVSSSEDRTIRIWDMSSGSCLKLFQDYLYRVWSVALSPDGSTAASGGEDQMICLWDMRSGSRLKLFQGHTDRVRSVTFRSDGLVIASGSEDQTVRIWDVVSGKSLNTLQGHSGRVWSVAFSPDGTVIASGGDDQTVRLWDVASGDSLSILQGHADRIRSVAFSPDGRVLASGSEDQTVRLWEVSTGMCLAILQGHVGRIRAVAFSPQGNLLASSSDDGTIKFWDLHTTAEVKTVRMQKPYEGMNITGARGLTAAQKQALEALGAFEVSV